MPVTVRCTICEEEFQKPSLLVSHLSKCFSDSQSSLPPPAATRQDSFSSRSYPSSRASLSPASSCESLTIKRQRTTRNSQKTLSNEKSPVEIKTAGSKRLKVDMAPTPEPHHVTHGLKDGYRIVESENNERNSVQDTPAQVPANSNVNGYIDAPILSGLLDRNIKREVRTPEPELNLNIESVAGGETGVDVLKKKSNTEKSRDDLDWYLTHPALGQDQDLDAIPDDVWLSEVKEEPIDEEDFMEAVEEETVQENDLRNSVDEAHQRDLENSEEIQIEETHAETSVEDLVSYSKQCFGSKAKRFPCSYCHKTFNSKSAVIVHERRHTGEKPYKCKKCDKRFVDNGDLKKHALTHNNKKSFKCNECDASFKLRRNLQLHKSVHTGEKKYQCNVCQARFRLPSMLDSHYRIHTGYKPYHCEVCGKSFRVSYTYRIHQRTHTNEKPFQCTEVDCDYSSRDKPSMVKHMRKHTQERPYDCNVCGKSFQTTGTLNTHLQTHGGERKFQCIECPWAFHTAANLSKHMLTHTGEKTHECSVCGRRFAQRGNLAKHMMYHDEKSFQCMVCDKMFYTREDARKHENEVHNPVKMFGCVECGKSFSRKEHLKKHAEMHAGIKNYQCQFCEKKFKHSSSKSKHEKRFHTDVPCLLCKFCPTEFKRYTNYAKHVSKYHPGMDWQCDLCGGKYESEMAFLDHAHEFHGVRLEGLQENNKMVEPEENYCTILPDCIEEEPSQIY